MLIVLCTLVLTMRAEAQLRAYTSEEAAGFRGHWSLENWDKGGPLMRYVFLNMTEFWNHSLILRGGPVRPLEEALRPEVAQFITTTMSGQKTLLDYSRESTVNGLLVLHHGRIVFETYPRMRRVDLHNYMSIWPRSSRIAMSVAASTLETDM